MRSNGATQRAFPPGIHGPSVSFFNDNDQQDIDWVTQERHLEYLVTSGLHGGTFFTYASKPTAAD